MISVREKAENHLYHLFQRAQTDPVCIADLKIVMWIVDNLLDRLEALELIHGTESK